MKKTKPVVVARRPGKTAQGRLSIVVVVVVIVISISIGIRIIIILGSILEYRTWEGAGIHPFAHSPGVCVLYGS